MITPWPYLRPTLQTCAFGATVCAYQTVGSPQTTVGRILYTIPLDRLSDWIASRQDSDVALISLQKIGNWKAHLFMLDLTAVTGATAAAYLARVNEELANEGLYRATWAVFDSGRSYHAYDTGVWRTSEEWSRAMGCALRAVAGEGRRSFARDDVDTHWIVHSLARGYGALRWTANQSRYAGFVPQLVGDLDVLVGHHAPCAA